LLIGLDDTIERQRGTKIVAKGIYRDPVRFWQPFRQGERSTLGMPNAAGAARVDGPMPGLTAPFWLFVR
jgi:hypothetical protein